MNLLRMRIKFMKSQGAKEKLIQVLHRSNVQQVKGVPETAIIAYDEKFYDELLNLFLAFDAKPCFIVENHETAISGGLLSC